MPGTRQEKPTTSRTSSKAAPASSGYDLYIMRHGKAAPRGPAWPRDAKRPLTPQGITDLRKISKGLIRLGVEVDWVVSSPLVRARQTAEVVSESFAPPLPVEITETLSPGASPEALLAFLAKHADRGQALLVGHEPDLSELACWLTGADAGAGFAFKKGGCCLIRFRGLPRLSEGRLLWWLTPSVLRKLA